MDTYLRIALDWINDIAYPDAGFIHANDENKVKCASRTLAKLGVVINNQEVIDYCKALDFPQESISKIEDWFNRPKGLRLKNGMKFSTSELKTIWKGMLEFEEKWDR